MQEIFYEVITPQTLQKFIVKCMSYGDELELKTAILASESGITSHFNNCLFNSIKEFPETIKNKDDFLNKVTIADRVALVSGLYHVTYGDEYITDTICPYCGTENSNKVKLTKHAKVHMYNGQPLEILDKTDTLKLEISNAEVNIKVPVLKKEVEILEEAEIHNLPATFVNLLLYIESIKINNVISHTSKNFVDMMATVKQLPSRDIRQIKKKIDEYKKYNFEISYKVKCSSSKCKKEYVQKLDFVEQFLRMVIES